MRRLLGLIPVLLIGVLLSMSACKDEYVTNVTNIENHNEIIGHSMYVWLDRNNFVGMDEDSERVYVTVALRDGNNDPIPDVLVEAMLSDTENAFLSLPWWETDYWTDSLGEQVIVFTATWVHDNLVTVSAAGLVDTQRIHVDYVIDDPYTLEVVSEPETLYASSAMPDSSEISVILRDPNGQGVEEYQIYLSTSGGSLDRIPESDSTGRASTWWHSDGEYGTFHITAYAWELTDTAWVTILPYPVGSVQIVCEDTLYILPGDSGLTPAVVIVTNTEGHVMPGKEVNITLANPLIGMLEFIDTALYDTTNQYGRVEMWYRAYHIGQNVISANCDGVSDFATILTLYP